MSLQSKILRTINRKDGSIALEASVVAPLFILLVLSLLMVLAGAEAELAFRSAAQKTNEEYSLLLTATEQSAVVFEEADTVGGDSVRDILITHLTGSSVLAQTEKWFSENITERPWLGNFIRNPKVFVDNRSERQHLFIRYQFEIPTFFGFLQRHSESVIPLWSPQIDALSNKSIHSDGELDNGSIWSEGNFVRGRYFRQHLSANLPNSYPVLSQFKEGKALATKSIDLTSPYYNDLTVLKQKVEGQINELASFSGTEKPWGSANIQIKKEDIKSKTLIIVVPENSPHRAEQTIEKLKSTALQKGVQLEIRKIGESKRYIDD